jgi:hypothetical protein
VHVRIVKYPARKEHGLVIGCHGLPRVWFCTAALLLYNVAEP